MRKILYVIPGIVLGMERIDYLDLEGELGHPFDVPWFFMRLLYGPLFWPILLLRLG
ncbi:MAG: hypothetical protein WCE38_13885 [Burkholderiales bacterium]